MIILPVYPTFFDLCHTYTYLFHFQGIDTLYRLMMQILSDLISQTGLRNVDL